MKKAILLSVFAFIFPLLSSSVQAETGRDRVKVLGDVTIAANETVKDVVAVRGNVTVNGTVEGNAVAVLGNISIGPKGVVKKDATAVRGTVALADGAKVFGSITEISGFGVSGGSCPFAPLLAGFFGFAWIFLLAVLAGLLALGALLAALFPGYFEKTSAIMDTGLLKPFLWGALISVLVLPATLLLVLTLIGILFIPLEIVILFIALCLGYFAASHYFGRKLLAALYKGGSISAVWEMLAGLVLLFLAQMIPFLGPFVKLFAVLLGIGVVALSIRSSK